MLKFKTDSNPFASDYAEKAHLQKNFNARLVDDLAAYIANAFPETQASPLVIADLCCGDGGATYHFFKAQL